MNNRWFLFVLVSLLLLYLLLAHFRNFKGKIYSTVNLDSFPLCLREWKGADFRFDKQYADSEILREYRNAQEDSIWLYVGHYHNLLNDLPGHTPLNCYPSQGWRILKSQERRIAVDQADPWNYKTLLIEKNREKELVLYWYQNSKRSLRGTFIDMLRLIRDAIASNRSDAVFVRVSTGLRSSEEETLAMLIEFVNLVRTEVRKVVN